MWTLNDNCAIFFESAKLLHQTISIYPALRWLFRVNTPKYDNQGFLILCSTLMRDCLLATKQTLPHVTWKWPGKETSMKSVAVCKTHFSSQYSVLYRIDRLFCILAPNVFYCLAFVSCVCYAWSYCGVVSSSSFYASFRVVTFL